MPLRRQKDLDRSDGALVLFQAVRSCLPALSPLHGTARRRLRTLLLLFCARPVLT